MELFGREIERIGEIDPVSGKRLRDIEKLAIYPAKHFVTTEGKVKNAVKRISEELKVQLAHLREN